jgi:hypothetical protein
VGNRKCLEPLLALYLGNLFALYLGNLFALYLGNWFALYLGKWFALHLGKWFALYLGNLFALYLGNLFALFLGNCSEPRSQIISENLLHQSQNESIVWSGVNIVTMLIVGARLADSLSIE